MISNVYNLILIAISLIPFYSTQPHHEHVGLQLKKIASTEQHAILENSQTELDEQLSAETDIRLYPNPFDKNATLLLYLREPVNTVQLQIINTYGQTVGRPLSETLDKGFYELSITPDYQEQGVLLARFEINGKNYSKYIIR